MFGALLHHRAQVLPADYLQDRAGGELQSYPALAGLTVHRCCLQQDTAPARNDGGQPRHGSSSEVAIFFARDPQVKQGDRLRVLGAGLLPRVVVCEGPAFDRSGQGGGLLAAAVLWEVTGQETR